MKRQFIFDGISTGFIGGFEEVSLSRNERTGAWTVYFRCDDLEAGGTIRHKAGTPAQFVEIFRRRGVSIEQFCRALDQDDEQLRNLRHAIEAQLTQVAG